MQVFLFRLETYLGSEMFELSSPITVGRHPRAHLKIDGDNISRNHCRLVPEDGQLFVEDLGSSNGTFVNRLRVKGRMAVESTDAIHIGNYTLKLRMLGAEPKRRIDPREGDVETRIEAILSIDVTGGAREAAVALQANLDKKLYEAAIRRQTGGEEAKAPAKTPAPRPLRATLPIGGETLEDSTLMAAAEVSLMPEPKVVRKKSEEVALDPSVEARLRDLDELIAALDAKSEGRRPSEARGPWQHPKSLEVDDEGETSEFARDLASSLALAGEMVAEAKVIPIDSRRKSTSKDRRSFDAAEETTEEAEDSAEISVEIDAPLRKRTGLEARLLTPTEMRARVSPVAAKQSSAPAPVVQAPAPKTEVDESIDSAMYDDVWASRIDEPPLPIPLDRPKGARPASEMPIHRMPPSPPPPPSAPPVELMSDEDDTVAANEDEMHFDGIELASRVGGRLADIAVLRKAGDQFILGHPTPQGSVAPGKAHVGLRLLRINADRSVDLVFPRDAAGHLVRGSTTVMFSELTEGRKYSCLRLETRDVATVILGEGRHAISYHIRFLRRPKSLFRSLERAQRP